MMTRRRRSEYAGKVGGLLDARRRQGEGLEGGSSSGSAPSFVVWCSRFRGTFSPWTIHPKRYNLLIRTASPTQKV